MHVSSHGYNDHVIIIAIANYIAINFTSTQPNFGASMHILKVEIGGDAVSSGMMLSYMHMTITHK